jgi:hypothetical protein
MWQPREPPVGHGGYRKGKIVSEISTEFKEPQECAEGSDQRLRERCATLRGSFKKKGTKGLCLPLADILSQRSE